jgi:enoyl-CoA hydratase/carnithine racemase
MNTTNRAAHGLFLFAFLALAVAPEAPPKKALFDIAYNARLISAEEARALHLVNQAMPRDEVLPRAIEVVEKVHGDNPSLPMLGRDLYYSMRGNGPAEASEKAPCAGGGAQDEGTRRH